MGCYPCQGFSQGGVRDPGRKINTLYLELLALFRAFGRKRSLLRTSPAWCVATSATCRKTKSRSSRKQATGCVLGIERRRLCVAQERRRIFIVGLRSQMDYAFPVPHIPRDSRTTIAQALAGMPDWPEGELMHESSIGTTCLVIGVGIGAM